MKILTAGLALALLLSASGADAWPWSKKRDRQQKAGRLPKAIDSPIVRPKADESHKPGNKGRHVSQYQDAGWGSEFHRFTRARVNPNRVPFLLQE